MSSSTVASSPKVLSEYLTGSMAAEVALVVGYAGLIGLFAQLVVHLPFTPVPITGQTFAVLFGASLLGPMRSLFGSALYLIAGLIGVPWFAAGSGGMSVATSPSFGYIVGFIVASVLVGLLARRGFDKGVLGTIAEMVMGNLAIYAFGLAWLAYSLHLPLLRAADLGAVPFLLGDLVKILVAALALPGMWKLAQRFASPRL